MNTHINTPSSRKGFSLYETIGILAVIIALGLAGFYYMTNSGKGNGPNGNGGNGGGDKGEETSESSEEPNDGGVKEGEVVNRTVFEDELSEPMPAVNNVARLKEIFRPNTRYRSETFTTISGRASHKDLGIKGSSAYSMNVLGKAEILIKENDGRTIIAQVDILESSITEFRADPGVQIDLGKRFHKLFNLGAMTIGPLTDGGLLLPPGSSKVGEKLTNKFLQRPEVNELLSTLVDSERGSDILEGAGLMLSPPEIGGLHGTRFEVHYEDGKGVQKVIYIGPLEGYERDTDGEEDFVHEEDIHYLFQAGLFSAPHLIPEETLDDGDIHNVDASAFPAPFPPSWRARQYGKLSFGRFDTSSKRGEIYYRRGQFEAEARPKNRSIKIKFKPSEGSIHFETNPQQLKSLELEGEASYMGSSTDHWLFEAKHQIKPKFQTTHKIEIVE